MSQGKGSGWASGFFADARPRNDKCRSTRDHPTISSTFRAAALRSVAHAIRSLRRRRAKLRHGAGCPPDWRARPEIHNLWIMIFGMLCIIQRSSALVGYRKEERANKVEPTLRTHPLPYVGLAQPLVGFRFAPCPSVTLDTLPPMAFRSPGFRPRGAKWSGQAIASRFCAIGGADRICLAKIVPGSGPKVRR
jgi:hypothetical protein